MLLSDISECLTKYELITQTMGRLDINITGIEYDSRKVKEGIVFVCKGEGFKEEYLKSAVQNGACAYLSEKVYTGAGNLSALIVNDVRKALAQAATLWYDYPSEKLNTVGITGTKGKTTTSYMLKSIMERAGHKWGIIGTIEYDTGLRRLKPSNTTPESLDLQSYLNEMACNGLYGTSIEVSSQGLKHSRVEGCRFANAIFLNIGEDHISPKEHKDFHEYLDAKCQIFKYSNTGIINGDDPNYQYIVNKAHSGRVVLFGFSDYCDFKAYDIIKEGRYLKFTVRSAFFVHTFKISMFGSFNIYNALAAIASAALLGISKEDIYNGLKDVSVRGRAEVIDDGALTVIVDYAHNKMSFETLLKTVRDEYSGRRVITVYGCPGDKAYLRRRDMGKISARLAHYTYLTADDPGYEGASKIMDEIGEYIEKYGGDYEKISDREEAIKKSVLKASEGDVIVIAGKGHETTQIVDGQYAPFEGDYALAVKYLKQREKLSGSSEKKE